MNSWFEEHFQEDYLRVYDHRDEGKAANELREIMEYVPLEKGMKVIDLCCGNGRHARWLARKGFYVTGIDLSSALLKKAIELTEGIPVKYQRGDIRNIPLLQEYDGAFNLFTSFGYFTDDAENELVFTKACEALKENGWFVFDYLNPTYVKNTLVPEDNIEKDGLLIKQQREVNSGYVFKKITIREGDSQREYMERVKLYDQQQLIEMLERNHFTLKFVFGDYDCSSYDTNRSPRQIFICQKKENGKS